MATRRRKPGEPPRKKGRQRNELDAKAVKQLEIMAGLGLTWPQIAACLEIPKRTLLERRKDTEAVADAYERGRARAELVIGQALFNRAKGGDVPAIRWWEMTRAGRREGISLAGMQADEDENSNAAFLPVEIRLIDAKPDA